MNVLRTSKKIIHIDKEKENDLQKSKTENPLSKEEKIKENQEEKKVSKHQIEHEKNKNSNVEKETLEEEEMKSCIFSEEQLKELTYIILKNFEAQNLDWEELEKVFNEVDANADEIVLNDLALKVSNYLKMYD